MTVPIDSNNQFDPWLTPEIEPPSQSDDSHGSPLRITTVRNVEPLDRQFGMQPKKTVPETLYDTLLGQPDPSETEIAAAGGDPAAVPPMRTYAVLDAAKVMNLPELLAASALKHHCLFKGKSCDELKNVAPWIVQLENGNDFTRRLFTGPKGINGLWDKEPGIYIRSRASLEDMRKHFRKFTRVTDENGNWFYFRFWEAGYADSYFETLGAYPERLRAWLMTESGKALDISIASRKAFTTFSYHPDMPLPGRQNSAFRYESPERAAHIQVKRHEFVGKLCRHLCSISARFDDMDTQRQRQLAANFVHFAAQFGMKIERSVADFAAASILLGQRLEKDMECLPILKSDIHQLDKGKKLLAIMRNRRKS